MLSQFKIAILILILSTGCGSSSLVSNFVLSCNYPTAYYCNDYGAGYSSTTAQTACTSGGVFSTAGACSTSSRLGSCLITGSALILTTRYYSGLSGGSASAQAACALVAGTWAAD